MPCFYVVSVSVEDEASAIEALKALGLRPERYLRKTSSGLKVEGLQPSQERAFKMEYAKNFTRAKARKRFYTYADEEVQADGSIKMTFRKMS